MLPLPAVEIEIAGSAVLIGAMVLLALRPTLGLAAVIVAFFALFHGYAHGTQMPNAANPLAYAIGFVIGTGLLHLVGIALGLVTRMPRDALAVRAAGGAIALAGLYFLANAMAWRGGWRWLLSGSVCGAGGSATSPAPAPAAGSSPSAS